MSNLKNSTQSTINQLVNKGMVDKARQLKKDIESMYPVRGLKIPKA